MVLIGLLVLGVFLWGQRQARTLKAIEQGRDAVAQQMAQLRDEQEAWQRQMADREQALAALEDELTNVVQANTTMAAEREALVARADAHRQERQSWQQEWDTLSRELETLRAQQDQQAEGFAALQKAQRELATQRDAALRQLAKVQDLRKERELKSQLVERQRRLDALAKAHRAAEQRIRGLRKEETTLHKELKALSAQRDRLANDRETLLKEQERLEAQVRKTPAQVTRLARQHERLVRQAADMHYNMGVVFSQRKSYSRALKEFLEAVELRPDDADAYYNIGVLYAEHLPNRPKAVSYFQKYLQISPRAQDASWVRQYIASWETWESKERLQ